MLLSPEIPIFQVPDRAVVVRIDDILLIVMFLSWLAKTAVTKGFGFLKNTPINKPLIIYTLFCILFTLFAILLGIGKAKFENSVFYILKYSEYVMIFFLALNSLNSLKQMKVFTVLMLVVCCIIALYGYWQLHNGASVRVSAPFEGEKPEPNTLAGYLIVMLGIIGGLLFYGSSGRQRLILSGLFLFILPIFLFTLSRAGYIGFAVLYFGFLIFNRKPRFFLIIGLFIIIVILPYVLPLSVIERVRLTFQPDSRVGKTEYVIGARHVKIEASAAARFEVWRWVLPLWIKSPVFGYGTTGLGFIDGQYLRILAETGILGLWAFFWLLLRLFFSFLRIYNTAQDQWLKGLSLGMLSALCALFIVGWGSNVFIIVRIMEPFWFLAGMVLAASHLEEKEGVNLAVD
jgi:O-antigen ligase